MELMIFFTNIGPELASKFQNINEREFMKFMEKTYTHSMYMQNTNPDEIIKLINKLDSKKSPGFDELSAIFFYNYVPPIYLNLLQIYLMLP